MHTKWPVTISCLVMIMITIMVTACSNANAGLTPPVLSHGATPGEDQRGAEVESRLETTLIRIVVQRGQDRYSLRTQPGLNPYGLVTDIQHIRWIAIRGGAGIEPIEKEVLDPVRESVTGKQVWVRFYYEPYKPEQGMNDRGHKDIVVYTDPENVADAILGIQNPDHQERWDMFVLHGYGPWLQKEIDILLRLAAGM